MDRKEKIRLLRAVSEGEITLAAFRSSSGPKTPIQQRLARLTADELNQLLAIKKRYEASGMLTKEDESLLKKLKEKADNEKT